MRRLRFSPRSSFARTLLLIVTLLFASLVTTYLVVLNFAILPSLQQFNKVLAYEVRMLMTDKLQLEDGTQLVVPPAFRREIYRELGISLYSNEAAEEAGLRWAQHYEFLSHQMAQQLGGPTEVRVEVNKSSPVVWLKTWLSPNIWVRVPLTEIHQGDFSPLFRYTLAIMLLAIGGAWLFIRIQNRPLVDLEHAALQVGKGIIPPPLREYGASEVRSVTRAFNHMAAGVKQLADDRTLLMAGPQTLASPSFLPPARSRRGKGFLACCGRFCPGDKGETHVRSVARAERPCDSVYFGSAFRGVAARRAPACPFGLHRFHRRQHIGGHPFAAA